MVLVRYDLLILDDYHQFSDGCECVKPDEPCAVRPVAYTVVDSVRWHFTFSGEIL